MLGKLANMHADLGDIYASVGMHEEAVREFRAVPPFEAFGRDPREAVREVGGDPREEPTLDHLVRFRAAASQSSLQLFDRLGEQEDGDGVRVLLEHLAGAFHIDL